MDIKQLNVLTLTGPNWGSFSVVVQAAARILNCWDVIKGEALGTIPQTYNLFKKPTAQMHMDSKELAATTAAWNKKNSQGLGLIQGTILLALY